MTGCYWCRQCHVYCCASHNVLTYFYIEFVLEKKLQLLLVIKPNNFLLYITEKKFLQFFFSRIQLNETGSYPEFPFLSLCGRERNYIRCDDLPLVFTHLVGCLLTDIHLHACFLQLPLVGLPQIHLMLLIFHARQWRQH